MRTCRVVHILIIVKVATVIRSMDDEISRGSRLIGFPNQRTVSTRIEKWYGFLKKR